MKENASLIGFVCGFIVFISFVSLVPPVHVIEAVIGLALGFFVGYYVQRKLKRLIVPKTPRSPGRAKRTRGRRKPVEPVSIPTDADEREKSNKPHGHGDYSRANDREHLHNWPIYDESIIILRLRIIARNDDLFDEALRRVKESFKKIDANVKYKYAKETELCHGAIGMWTMHYLRSTGRSVGLLDQKLMEWLVQRARKRGGHAFSSMLRDLGSRQS